MTAISRGSTQDARAPARLRPRHARRRYRVRRGGRASLRRARRPLPERVRRLRLRRQRAHDDGGTRRPGFAAVVNGAASCCRTACRWSGRSGRSGLPQRRRVRVAPDLLMELFTLGEGQRNQVGLYGGTRPRPPRIQRLLAGRIPGLQVTYAWSPPFRPLDRRRRTCGHARSGRQACNSCLWASAARSRSEWMAGHAGPGGARVRNDRRRPGVRHPWRTHPQCPEMDAGPRSGVAFRLMIDPGRLWKRYLYNNPRFILLFTAQVLRTRLTRRHRRHAASGRRRPH